MSNPLTTNLILGDCLEQLKALPDLAVDLTVTSPPYDSLRSYENLPFEKFQAIARELYRVTKEGAVIVWIVGDGVVKGSETGTSFKQALFFKEVGFNLHDTMIYYKRSTPFPSKTRYNNSFEYMFVFSKSKPKTVNLIQDKPNSCAGQTVTGSNRKKDGSMEKFIGYRKRKIKNFGIRNNIWEINCGFNKSTTDQIAYQHPAIFPESLAADHIKSWSNESDTVLDPFMGSGTTGKMAMSLNRSFIGIEKEPKYFEIAEKRIFTAFPEFKKEIHHE